MDRPRLATLALAALLLFAGCAGTLPGTDSGSTDTDAAAYPPGVSESNVNATAATAAHRAALNDSSLTLSMRMDQGVGDRSQNVSSVQRVGPDHVTVWSEVDARGTTRTVYLTEDTQYVRLSDGNRTRYDARRRTMASSRLLTASPTAINLVNWTFSNGDFAVTGTKERDGTTRTTLTASSLAANATKPTAGNLTGFEATAVVDEEGVVRSLSYSIELARDGKTYTSSVSMNVSGVGSTDVSEPDWLDEARNRTTAAA